MAPLLSAQRIAELCQPAAQAVAVRVVASTGSTNSDLLADIGMLSSPVLLIAESQTAGRGRAGRAWHSAPDASLTFSLAWNFKRPVQELAGLPLAIGAVIAEVLKSFGIHTLLKWPNDVLKSGRKLAGILIETASVNSSRDYQTWAVIGIGLNLAMPDGLATRIGHAAADASKSGLDRHVLMAVLLNALTEALMLFEAQGFSAFVTRWNALHAYAGQQVVVIDHGRILHEGIATGVDATGRLQLDTVAGRVAVMAGDVSLRLQED